VTTTIIIIVLVAAVVGYIVFRSQRKKQQAANDQARGEMRAVAERPGGSLEQLRVGDVVGMDDAMWIVEGTLRFDEDGFLWQEHLIVDGDRRLWLSVENDEGVVEVGKWNRGGATNQTPDADQIDHEGVSFKLVERGSARYTSEGSTGMPTSGKAEYADYSAGTSHVSFERFTADGSWEMSTGVDVPVHAIDVYPGGSGAAPK
jgi:Domain of unknown function (DUF4178)